MPVCVPMCVCNTSCMCARSSGYVIHYACVCVCVLQFVIAACAAAAAVWEQQKICKIVHTPRVRVYFNWHCTQAALLFASYNSTKAIRASEDISLPWAHYISGSGRGRAKKRLQLQQNKVPNNLNLNCTRKSCQIKREREREREADKDQESVWERVWMLCGCCVDDDECEWLFLAHMQRL